MKYAPYVALASGLFILSAVGLSAATEVIPNLKALPASDIRLAQSGSSTLLRFSTTGWNDGVGPLEVFAGEIDRENGKQNVYQRIYNTDGTVSREPLVGSFIWHEAHNHFHFEDYATYTLQLAGAPGASDRFGQKTTFCIMDTTRMNTKLSGAPKRPVYDTCGSVVQGMSVGWGDTYGYQLAGQEIDVTGLADGDYKLIIELDPKDKLDETNEGDNVSIIDIRISNGTVSVIGGGSRGRGNH
ncbi:hypothetical protein A3F55_01575 [Candidatus Adlerbacteria bacterium RIFCSPHIGHO2_12_FULL_53_18]|uniref:Lysyl oxidase n=1 Tax=Candidatus Adlerbacteria bacterium RIFCSPHIGHO2_12_FULL_53_18 TaxID=1797242 RepID=A0A1F4XRL8_9BACT|nr:MAG: hypothetical protein A3F55_01575 [Candidatus Adlerbacteria bacterium RIFCSPHIGHO2_12_FULL_53_18]